MQTDPGPIRPLGVLGLVGNSFRLLFAHFPFLFPLAFVPALVLSGMTLAFGPDAAALDEAQMPQITSGTMLVLLVDIVLSFLITGVMCLAALDALLGKRHGIGDYLRQTLRHFAPIAVLGLLVSIATGFGLLLLVLPGLYIFARYLPLTPVVVFENAGWTGLARAQSLTEGYRWPLAGAVLLLGVAVAAIVLVLSPIFAAAAGSGLFAAVIEAAFAGFYYALIAIFTALAYLRLREVSEGATPEEIAATID